MRYFLVAGERSGDEYAAELVRSIQAMDDLAVFQAYGGSFLKQTGVLVLQDYASFSTFGFTKVFNRLWFYKRLLDSCQKAIFDFQPDYLIVVDFSGFNLRLISQIMHVKIVYFIAPKLWAWGSSRMDVLRKHADLLLVIFPFEEGYFRSRGCSNVKYVGNPSKWKMKNLPKLHKMNSSIALLPGSRAEEVNYLVPILAQVVSDNRYLSFEVAAVDNLSPKHYEPFLNFPNVRIVWNDSIRVTRNAAIAVVASGTATLETCLVSTPQVVIYRTHWVTYAIARLLVKVKFISLVNILAGREVVKELIQTRCTPAKISKELKRLMNEEVQKKISEDYSEISKSLGETNPFQSAAKAIIDLGCS